MAETTGYIRESEPLPHKPARSGYEEFSVPTCGMERKEQSFKEPLGCTSCSCKARIFTIVIADGTFYAEAIPWLHSQSRGKPQIPTMISLSFYAL